MNPETPPGKGTKYCRAEILWKKEKLQGWECPSLNPKPRDVMGRSRRAVTRSEANGFIFTFAYVLMKTKTTPKPGAGCG